MANPMLLPNIVAALLSPGTTNWTQRTNLMTAKPPKLARVGYGLRERLLLSFIAISAFAVVAALVGNYAFYAIGEPLHPVPEKSGPPATATLELSQRTERSIAAGPSRVAATS